MSVNFTASPYAAAGFKQTQPANYYGQSKASAVIEPIKEAKPGKVKAIAIGAAVAAIAAAVTTAVAFVKGKTINTALGSDTKLLANTKQGFYAMFKKSGRELYKGITEKIAGIYTDVNREQHAINELGKDFPQLVEGNKILESLKNGELTGDAANKARRHAAKFLHPDMVNTLVSKGELTEKDAEKLLELYKAIFSTAPRRAARFAAAA